MRKLVPPDDRPEKGEIATASAKRPEYRPPQLPTYRAREAKVLPVLRRWWNPRIR